MTDPAIQAAREAASDELRGWATLDTGERVELSAEQCRALIEMTDAEQAKRAADMPDEQTALRVMFSAFQRLRELGWREAIYCPKDGTTFDAIEAGSTGIHRCHYSGEWPKGGWWITAHGDQWPSRPILFRPGTAAVERAGEARDE